jgi:hypothetical protein
MNEFTTPRGLRGIAGWCDQQIVSNFNKKAAGLRSGAARFWFTA